MPLMMDELTSTEKDELAAINAKYEPLLEASHKEVSKAMAAWNKATKKAHREKRPLKAEEDVLSDALKTASDKNSALNTEWQEARSAVKKLAETRLFDSYNGNVSAIIDMIKSEIPRIIAINRAFARVEPTEDERNKRAEQTHEQRQQLINAIYKQEEQLEKDPGNEELLKATEGLKELLNSGAYNLTSLYDLMFSDDNLRDTIKTTFTTYFSFLRNAEPTEYKNLMNYVEACIADKDHIAKNTLNNHSDEKDILRLTAEFPKITTKYPSQYVVPTDMVTRKTFEGGLRTGELEPVKTGRKGNKRGIPKNESKKEITAFVKIDIDELKNVVMSPLTPLDQQVHNAIVTLYIEGENEYVTSPMIYQVMTGNPDAVLSKKRAQEISDSITKCLYSRLTIDASAEAKAFGFESFKYEGSLISGERVTATLNGTVVECLHILRTPVLYEYAGRKKQIGRFDIKLLNSPIRKTEEIITLQDCLSRRILAMKGNPALSKTIVYDTVYSQIGVTAISPGALRVKKANIRKQIKTILNYWQTEGFIIGYAENTRKTEVYSVSIRLKNTD